MADIPCLAAPPGDAHRARGSRFSLLLGQASAGRRPGEEGWGSRLMPASTSVSG